MRRAAVSTGLSFIDLLCGALIAIVILYIISPLDSGNTTLEHELSITHVCENEEIEIASRVSISGKNYDSSKDTSRDKVKWTRYASNVLKANIKVDGRPTVQGHLFISDSEKDLTAVKCSIEPTMGYSVVLKVFLRITFISKHIR